MAKNKPGMPENFTINVSNPAELGDYLDEDLSSNVARALIRKTEIAPPSQNAHTNVVEHPTSARVIQPPLPEAPPRKISSPESYAAPREEKPSFVESKPRPVSKTKPFKRPGRMQFNLRPETEAMFEELVEFAQRYSTQMDVTASEIFEGLVNILHQAKDEMSFEEVPRRGKWGTPTAKAFPVALGNAFAKAIATKHNKLKQTE